jgi:hypothetical protein
VVRSNLSWCQSRRHPFVQQRRDLLLRLRNDFNELARASRVHLNKFPWWWEKFEKERITCYARKYTPNPWCKSRWALG